MSWSGFASLAKTALKEAQKTIDIALDIKDEEQKQQSVKNREDFKNSSQQSASVWGSFTGSFFDNPTLTSKTSGNVETNTVSESSLSFSKSFPESLSDSSSIKSITEQNITCASKSTSSEEFISESASTSENVSVSSSGKHSSQSKLQEKSNDDDVYKDSESSKNLNKIVSRKKEQHLDTNRHSLNRLSILSAESDKKSSESVEILSLSTDCTNSPDSDFNSQSITSLDCSGQKLNSESVEVVTSPSSIDDGLTDDDPYASPLDEKIFETSITPTPGDSMITSVDGGALD